MHPLDPFASFDVPVAYIAILAALVGAWAVLVAWANWRT